LAFDEALETFGVKFIKQYLIKRLIDIDSLKLQIKSAQNEQDRINPLISQFLDAKKPIRKDHKIESKKDVLWKLVDDLLDLFENFDHNTNHHLLKGTPEFTNEGFSLLFNCYDIGKERMCSLLRQEVYEMETKVVNGRRMKNVNVYEYNDLQNLYNTKKKNMKPHNQNLPGGSQVFSSIGESSTSVNDFVNININDNSFPDILTTNKKHSIQPQVISDRLKRQKRTTTVEEHTILDPLVKQDHKPTEEQIKETIERICWDRERLVSYIYRHRKGKQRE